MPGDAGLPVTQQNAATPPVEILGAQYPISIYISMILDFLASHACIAALKQRISFCPKPRRPSSLCGLCFMPQRQA